MKFIIVGDHLALNIDRIIRVNYFAPDAKSGSSFARIELLISEQSDPLVFTGEDADRVWQKVKVMS